VRQRDRLHGAAARRRRLAHAMMLINGFLGEVVHLETVLNEFSYNIALYGEPDLRAPWGWQAHQYGGGSSSGGCRSELTCSTVWPSPVMPGGRLLRVTPLGVVMVRTPSAVMT
jgi:hypothetical protein